MAEPHHSSFRTDRPDFIATPLARLTLAGGVLVLGAAALVASSPRQAGFWRERPAVAQTVLSGAGIERFTEDVALAHVGWATSEPFAPPPAVEKRASTATRKIAQSPRRLRRARWTHAPPSNIVREPPPEPLIAATQPTVAPNPMIAAGSRLFRRVALAVPTPRALAKKTGAVGVEMMALIAKL